MQGIGSVKKSGSDIYGMKNENIRAQHGMGSVKEERTYGTDILLDPLEFLLINVV